MAKCVCCGKKGLFLKVNSVGHCPDCAALIERKNQEVLRRSNQPSRRKSLFDISFPGETLRYKYTDIPIESPVVYPDSILHVGSVCGFFRMEKDSDQIEVTISHGNDTLLIGFLPSGKLSDMAGDWFDRSWTSGGQVSSIKEGRIYIDMAFWTPDSER